MNLYQRSVQSRRGSFNPAFILRLRSVLKWQTTLKKESDAVFQKNPMITLCGTARISRKIAFVTENWIIPYTSNSGQKYTPVFSYGLRFFGETLSVDLAFINNKEIFEILFTGIPFVAFAVKY